MVAKGDRRTSRRSAATRLRDFNNKQGPFTDRDLYVVVYDMKGKVLAHGANEKMIGKDVIELRDNDGKYFVKERVEMMSQGPGRQGLAGLQVHEPGEPRRSSRSRCSCSASRTSSSAAASTRANPTPAGRHRAASSKERTCSSPAADRNAPRRSASASSSRSCSPSPSAGTCRQEEPRRPRGRRCRPPGDKERARLRHEGARARAVGGDAQHRPAHDIKAMQADEDRARTLGKAYDDAREQHVASCAPTPARARASSSA